MTNFGSGPFRRGAFKREPAQDCRDSIFLDPSASGQVSGEHAADDRDVPSVRILLVLAAG